MDFDPKRSIYLNGGINTDTILSTIMGLSSLYIADPKSVITLFITSNGGSVSDSFALYDYVTHALKPRLQTVALGEVNSSAVILFLAGTLRHIGKLALMRFHRFSLTNDLILNSKNTQKMGKDLERGEANYIDILMSRSKGIITKKMANDLLDNNRTVTAIESVKLGLAHKIL